MSSHGAPRSLRQGISVQQIGTETLLYDERRHMAFCLNQSSSIVWKLADGEHTIAAISAAATVELNAPISEEFVLFALGELRRDGLMEASAIAEVAPTISRRAMLRRLGVGGAMLLPVIAAIVAPTAAQAYSGCVDCTSDASQVARVRRQQLRDAQRRAAAPASSPQK